ncbi:MAG: reprolysin-like metallopeptidase [Flavisolibacter sp.]
MRKSLLSLVILLTTIGLHAQKNYWTATNEASLKQNIFPNGKKPSSFQLFRLNEGALRADLKSAPSEKKTAAVSSGFILSVPDADGKIIRFKIVEAPVMAPALAIKFPGINSYAGIGIDDPSAVLRFAFSPLGFSGTIFSSQHSTMYIDQVEKTSQTYMVVYRDRLPEEAPFKCSTVDVKKAPGASIQLKNADDAKLRSFRLALACSGEFSASWLDGTEADDAARKAKVLAGMNGIMTRINGVNEIDLDTRLIMIGDEDKIIYLDAATDPWTTEYNTATQAAIDAQIGNANYDIGHVFLMKGDNDGNAGCIGCVCNSSNKGSGYTSHTNWKLDASIIDYPIHEMGHQLGANHTFSYKSEGPTPAQVEPGSGTTIMGYAGITGANDVAKHSTDNFHAISIQQITDNIKAKSCPTVTNTGDNVPTASAGFDYTIPRSTPFKLTGSGTDADGEDVFTYTWEQMDVASSFPWFPSTTATDGPAFRSFAKSASPSRTFPSLNFILDGSNTDQWEKLPAVARSMNFRFTVRDNHPGGGSNQSDDMVVNVDGSTGPFQVTSPNSLVEWCPGTHTVTWDVAGTNGAPINVSKVNILLSTDGGNNFTPLASNVDNDGSQDVTIVCGWSNHARIKVEAVGNIFFDISNADFVVGDHTPPTFTAPGNITIFKDASCNYNADPSITGDVTDEADNCDNSLNATYTDVVTNGSCVGEQIITRTWRLEDDCSNVTTHTQVITARDATPPSFTAPPPITIFADASCGYNASTAITGDVTDEADNCDHTLDATYSDVVTNSSCVGNKTITRTWTLTDDCGNTTSHVQIILVKDNTPPVISAISANPPALWPPNHKMINVVINYTAKDNCSAVTSSLSVVSNEPINGTGDGDTAPDWIVVDNHHLQLRAERAGNRDGRVYTITITATDDCGNTSKADVSVVVNHDNSITRMIPGDTNAPNLELIATPNPARTNFTVFARSNTNERMTLQVVDVLGRIVEARIITPGSRIVIGDQYKSGNYFVRVTQGRQQAILKLIKLSD